MGGGGEGGFRALLWRGFGEGECSWSGEGGEGRGVDGVGVGVVAGRRWAGGHRRWIGVLGWLFMELSIGISTKLSTKSSTNLSINQSAKHQITFHSQLPVPISTSTAPDLSTPARHNRLYLPPYSPFFNPLPRLPPALICLPITHLRHPITLSRCLALSVLHTMRPL